nr:uracil-DNA glycosylase [Nanoarchaeum sp.]
MIELTNLENAAKKHELYKNVISTNGNIVFFRGNLNNPEYLFIGEAPGQEENKIGKPFVGRSGKVLDGWINSAEIKDFIIINTVPIIPLDSSGGIRKPTSDEINYFKPYVDSLIKSINPKRIICLGKSALEYMDITLSNLSWKENVGFIYHPSFYLRRGMDGKEDFKKLILNKNEQKSLGEF